MDSIGAISKLFVSLLNKTAAPTSKRQVKTVFAMLKAAFIFEISRLSKHA
jgi:hypothetical protein